MTSSRERRQTARGKRPGPGADAWSERLVYFIVGWIILVVLVPLHGLLVMAFFFTDSVFGVVFWLLIFGLPLGLIDLWAFNWFRDNMGAFRGINRHLREQQSGTDGKARR